MDIPHQTHSQGNRKTLDKAEPPPAIDEKEISNATKKIKRKKTLDYISNDVFLEATKETREIFREVLNTITQTEEIPDEWQVGNIITMYKVRTDLRVHPLNITFTLHCLS